MNPKTDRYFTDGCGRCHLGGTPGCKVHNWKDEMKLLRTIILDCGLTEDLKWKVPCYTLAGSNILLMSAFKEYCAVSFFKGSLLSDTHGILEKPGENSQATRLIKYTGIREILETESVLKAFIFEAIEAEKAGLKVDFKKAGEYRVPEEFQRKLDELPALKTAYNALTPGRQKGYLLYFSQPKQSKTREARIEKCMERIFQGRGLHDR